MSNIPFLDNARLGENSWWKYLITISLSILAASILAGFIVIIFLIIYYVFKGSFSISSIPLIVADTSQPLFLLLLIGVSYLLSTLLFYICIRVLHKRSLLSVITAYPQINWGRILKGILLWFFILGIFSIPSLILYPSEYVFTFNLQSFGLLVVLSLLVFPIQASFEEIFFRGYLMQGVGLLTKKPIIPLLVTSIIFGSFHFFNGINLNISIFMVIYTFILGLMLGIIVLGENGIETAMGVHIANNLFVSIFFNSTDSGLGNLPSLITSQKTDPTVGLITIVIAALILLTILFWNKKENLVLIFKSE